MTSSAFAPTFTRRLLSVARVVGTSVLLTMGMLSATPTSRRMGRYEIVRVVPSLADGLFDPREIVGSDVVVTLPWTMMPEEHHRPAVWSLN